MDYKNLFLTGFMGVGKSSIGAALAQVLDMRHLDLDATIEQEFGQSVFALFNLRGEEEFRQIEKEMLKSLGRTKGMVISLGGGTFIDPENRALVKEMGTSIYLSASVEFLTNRLYIERHQRPLLHKLQRKEDLKIFVTELLQQRASYYQEANFTIDVMDQTVTSIVSTIEKLICPKLS